MKNSSNHIAFLSTAIAISRNHRFESRFVCGRPHSTVRKSSCRANSKSVTLPFSAGDARCNLSAEGQAPDEDEDDEDMKIELTEEELALCGDFQPGLPVINKVVLVGRLGADPMLKSVGENLEVCTFPLAVPSDWDPDDGPAQSETDWFQVEAWGSLGQYVAKSAKKGVRVGVSGSFSINKWTGKDGEQRERHIITATTFEVLQSRSEQSPSTIGNSQYGTAKGGAATYGRRDSTALNDARNVPDQNFGDLPF